MGIPWDQMREKWEETSESIDFDLGEFWRRVPFEIEQKEYNTYLTPLGALGALDVIKIVELRPLFDKFEDKRKPEDFASAGDYLAMHLAPPPTFFIDIAERGLQTGVAIDLSGNIIDKNYKYVGILRPKKDRSTGFPYIDLVTFVKEYMDTSEYQQFRLL